jgi:hypothetical protein
MATAAQQRIKMKLLVLHAKGNTPESFRQRTSFLPSIIPEEEISCSYPCAPHDFEDNTYVITEPLPQRI